MKVKALQREEGEKLVRAIGEKSHNTLFYVQQTEEAKETKQHEAEKLEICMPLQQSLVVQHHLQWGAGSCEASQKLDTAPYYTSK